MVSLLGEKFIFSTSLRLPGYYEFLNFLFILMLSFSKTFQNILNYASTSNIQEIMRFYNLGDKSFETDFRFHPGLY